jgi:CheY-like chemotaxis protein
MNAQPPSKPVVLWVDDHPEHNAAERSVLAQHGYLVTTVRNTNQALAQINHRSFVAIISDMGRFEGPNEGYVLLEAIRRQGNKTPYFIYAGSDEQRHVEEAYSRGANGCTNKLEVLVMLVRAAPK